MTPRSRRARDVRALARALSERAGVPVEATYHGAGTDSWSGWHLWWSAGPSREQMRSIAAELTAELATDPAGPDGTSPSGTCRSGTDLATLRFERSLGDDHAATAVLAAMAERPDRPDDAAAALLRDDGELPGYPERQPAPIRRRAATLIAAGWRAHTAGDAASEIARHARTGGWPAVCAWLDDLGARQDAPVIPLRPSGPEGSR